MQCCCSSPTTAATAGCALLILWQLIDLLWHVQIHFVNLQHGYANILLTLYAAALAVWVRRPLAGYELTVGRAWTACGVVLVLYVLIFLHAIQVLPKIWVEFGKDPEHLPPVRWAYWEVAVLTAGTATFASLATYWAIRRPGNTKMIMH